MLTYAYIINHLCRKRENTGRYPSQKEWFEKANYYTTMLMERLKDSYAVTNHWVDLFFGDDQASRCVVSVL